MSKLIKEVQVTKVVTLRKVKKKESLRRRMFRFAMRELNINTYEEFVTFVKNSAFYLGGAAIVLGLFFFVFNALWFIAQ